MIVTTAHENLVRHCYNLPLTGRGVVNMIITDLAVFEVSDAAGYKDNVGPRFNMTANDYDSDEFPGLVLIEIAPDITVPELAMLTDAPFVVSGDLVEMQQ